MPTKRIRHVSHKTSHYVPLLVIFASALVAFVVFWQDKQFLIAVTIATASAYVVWGTMHHLLHEDLDIEVFIEYLVMAIIGSTILLSLI